MPQTTEIIEIKNPRQLPNYNDMIEDLRAIVIETEASARETVIVGYHELGKQIIDYGLDKPEFLQQVAQDIKKSKRTLYQILQFVNKWPDLAAFYEEAKEGKKVSWHLVCNRYLSGKKDAPELYYISCEELAGYLKENADFVSEKVIFTKNGVTLRITKDQLDKYLEGVKYEK